jgi:hypothetical protein
LGYTDREGAKITNSFIFPEEFVGILMIEDEYLKQQLDSGEF